MADLFSSLSKGVGAFSDLFGGAMGAAGYGSAAKEYQTAAGFATKNAETAQRSGELQEAQANRTIFKSVSGEQAAMAAGGTDLSGSNQYLLRASQQQGGLTRAVIANQTQQNVTGFQAEAAADTAQASQAEQQAKAAGGGGILGAIGGILSIF